MGYSSNSEKKSESSRPVSRRHMSCMDSKEDTGHLSCSGMKVSHHSFGSR